MERRWFLRSGVALGITAVLRSLEWAPALARQGEFDSDTEILNFVLAVTYVQIALYERGNEADLLSGETAGLLLEVAADERAQATLLEERIDELGGEPVEPPTVDVDDDTLEDRDDFLELAARLENAAVQGFLRLLPSIEDDDVLELVAGVYGVDARQAAVLADLAEGDVEGGVFRGPQELSIGRDEVADELSEIVPGGLPRSPETSPSPGPADDRRPATPAPSTPTPTARPSPTPTADATPSPTSPATPTPDDGGLLP